MNVFLKSFLSVFIGVIFLLTAVFVVFLIPPVQKAILLQILPQGTTVERIQLGVAGGSLQEFRMPLDDNSGFIHIPEANFRYKLSAMLTSRTAHLDYFRARHLNVELPVAANSGIESSVDAQAHELETLHLEVGKILKELEALRVKWVLGELALDGTLIHPNAGLFRFEIYGEGFAPAETGRLRMQWHALRVGVLDGVELASLKSVSTVAFSQSAKGAIERVQLQSNVMAQNRLNHSVLAADVDLNFAFVGKKRLPQLQLHFNSKINEPAILGETFRAFGSVELKSVIDLDAVGETFVLNAADLSLWVDAEPRLLASLTQSLSVGKPLPAGEELFQLQLLELPLVWVQLFAGNALRLSGSPLSAQIKVFGDGDDGFLFELPEFYWGPFALKDTAGEVLMEDLSVRMGMSGSAQPSGLFKLQVLPLTISVGDVLLLSSALAAEGDFKQKKLHFAQSLNLQLAALHQQPVAVHFADLLPSGWESFDCDLALSLTDQYLHLTQLQSSLYSKNKDKLLDVVLIQPLHLSLEGFQVQLSDADSEWLRVDLNALTLPDDNTFLPEGWRFSQRGISASIRVGGNDDGALINFTEPLRIAGIHLDIKEQPMLRDVDFTVDFTASISPRHLQIKALNFEAISSGRQFLKHALDLELVMDDWQASLESLVFSGESSIDLAAISRQPLLALQLQALEGKAQSRFNGNGLGQNLEIDLQIDNLKNANANATPVNLRGVFSMQAIAANDYRLVSQLNWGRAPAYQSSVISSRLQVRQVADLLRISGDLHAPILKMSDVEVLQNVFTPVAKSQDAKTVAAPAVASEFFAESPWAGMAGDLSFKVDTFLLPNGVEISAIGARVLIDEEALTLADGKAQIGAGTAWAEAKLIRNIKSEQFDLNALVGFNDLAPGYLAGRPATIQGTFNGKINIRGNGNSPAAAIEAAEVNANIEGRNGLMTLLDLQSPATGAAMIGLSLLGSQTRQPGVAAFSLAIPYFNELRFNHFGLDLQRNPDGLIILKELALIGPDLALSGEGRVAAGKWQDILNQAMRLNLDLGARGQLADALQTLGLVRSTIGEDGFQSATQRLTIGGTLANPDSKSLRDWLWQAAIGALVGGSGQPDDLNQQINTKSENPARSEKRPRDELEDVGRRLLEGLLGR